MTSRALKILLAALAVLALPAGAAHAALITYADGGNVWAASPDGAQKKQVTFDGTAASPYHLPSADDAGNVVAVKGGNTNNQVLTHVTPGGTRTVNALPWNIDAYVNFGPTGMRVKPSTGGVVAFSYIDNVGICTGCQTERTAVVPPTAPGNPNGVPGQIANAGMPAWYGNRLVLVSGGEAYIEKADQPGYFDWFANSPNGITRAEISQDGTRVLLEIDDQLYLYKWQGPYPGGQILAGCSIAHQGTLDRSWGLAPDGRGVVFADAGGVRAGRYDVGAHNTACVVQQPPVQIAPNGSEPSFSGASLPVPPPPPPPADEPTDPNPTNPTNPGNPTNPANPTGTKQPAGGTKVPGVQSGGTGTASGGGPTAPVSGKLPVTVPASTTAAKLARGLRVAATVPGPGRLTAKLGSLGTGKATVSRAGAAKVTVKLGKAGWRKVLRLRGRTLALRVTFVARDGTATKATARIRVK